MGKSVDFEKTKTAIAAFQGTMESKVNLGIGDDAEELALLLDGYRAHMLQIADDDFYEIAKIYNQIMTWVRLDAAFDEPPFYKKLSLVGSGGSGVSVTLGTREIDELQLILNGGSIAIAIEKTLLKDLDMVLKWFMLNAVTKSS